MINIVWKDITWTNGKYQVSNTGDVRSTYNANQYSHQDRVHIMAPKKHRQGYMRVLLSLSGESKFYYIHRLVAEAFLPNPDNLPQVNHKDENKENNFVFINDDGTVDESKSNLEWCTPSYNSTYGTRIQRINDKQCQPIQQIKDGVVVNEYDSIADALRALGKKCGGSISSCCLGKRKTAYGYVWKHKPSPEKIIAILDDLLINDNWDDDDK